MKKSEEVRQALNNKLKEVRSPNKDFQTRYIELQELSNKEKNDFENQLRQLNKDLEISLKENVNLKSYIDKLVDEIAKLKLEIKNMQKQNETESEKINQTTESNSISKKQYYDTICKVEEADARIRNLEDVIEELNNAKTLEEGEQCNLRYQLTDYKNKLEEQAKNIDNLESKLDGLNKTVKEKDDLINELKRNMNLEEYKELKQKYLDSENTVRELEKHKNDLIEQVANLREELEKSKEEVLRLTKELANEAEKNVRRNLEKELNETQLALDKGQESKANECK